MSRGPFPSLVAESATNGDASSVKRATSCRCCCGWCCELLGLGRGLTHWRAISGCHSLIGTLRYNGALSLKSLWHHLRNCLVSIAKLKFQQFILVAGKLKRTTLIASQAWVPSIHSFDWSAPRLKVLFFKYGVYEVSFMFCSPRASFCLRAVMSHHVNSVAVNRQFFNLYKVF